MIHVVVRGVPPGALSHPVGNLLEVFVAVVYVIVTSQFLITRNF
jgi:hypothetical protein